MQEEKDEVSDSTIKAAGRVWSACGRVRSQGDFMLEIMVVSIPGGGISEQRNRIQSNSPQVHFIDGAFCIELRAGCLSHLLKQ